MSEGAADSIRERVDAVYREESRRVARTSPSGDLILLADQDRSRWNRDQIADGPFAETKEQIGGYHLII